ncbi:hypothetical protein MSKOL_0920 [Methanosarcina sp. Kolksee]|nr:hypothetical protein MSKOL_0920 [Methanosarcina sp. Kolksee]
MVVHATGKLRERHILRQRTAAITIALNINICIYFIVTESTEELYPYFLYSVFSTLSVINLSLKIGE